MISRLLTPLVQLFYPHCCEICGTDLPATAELLCFRCIESLPVTNFQRYNDNPVMRLFNGRAKIEHAFSAYYYHQSSELRQLIHLFKYKKREDIAIWMGKQMGIQLQQNNWYKEIDTLVPVPLYPKKERERGYNQATSIGKGIGEVLNLKINTQLIHRQQYTNTQTQKGRSERWQNVADTFIANSPLAGRHLLLIDDVITTGATTEACAQALLRKNAKVSIATLALTWH
ncbi:ComF family protein [Chitinophaga silvatica]|uniref:ComF family protein n=1 Tax=Chitinophaga silvatica TaxID=2282649 RepID=A0A3E1YB40_9BACT|nr:ComF family protein [Chitinophaga silvatica]RFS23282.1 ComF family protein [Chitinophaga silvatica]